MNPHNEVAKFRGRLRNAYVSVKHLVVSLAWNIHFGSTYDAVVHRTLNLSVHANGCFIRSPDSCESV